MLVEITGKRNEEMLTTTSREVAEKFEKRHDNVLRDIENLIAQMGDAVSSKLRVDNQTSKISPDKLIMEPSNLFIETTYKAGTGKNYKEYLMTRDGFSLLAMGFTGEKALKWKLDYIKAFNAMEAELKRIYTERQQWQIERDKGVVIRHILTDTIKMKVSDSPNKRFAYPNYTKIIYKTIFGKNLKELQEMYKVKGNESIREYVTADELKQIEAMEMLVSSLINCGWGYDQIKAFIQINNVGMLAG